MKTISSEEKTYIRELAKEGMTIRQIRDRTGHALATVHRHAKGHLRTHRERVEHRRRHVRRLVEQGQSCAEVASQVGLCENTVYNYAGDIIRRMRRQAEANNMERGRGGPSRRS